MTDETIFAAALEHADATERAAYLDAVCPNPDQRRRVERLLAAHTDAGGFLEPAPPAPADTPTLPADVQPAVAGAALPFLQPSQRPGSLGRIGHYEVQEVLGSGGFGTVLRAFDERLHRVVAVKVLAPQLAASGAARARFLREGRSAAAVRDEHVVSVHAVSDDDEPVPYLVMEFVSGQTLQQKLDRSGPLPTKEVLRIGLQVARGLVAAHQTGLIHRDIKPANILLENGVERVKIADFGLARAADDASISQSGVVAGTPVFMSPEQARGDKVDPRSDLFSLGSVLYALCTGHAPFRAESTMGVLKRVIEDDPRPIRQTNPDVTEWLERIVAKLHAKRPDDRFQTAAEVADLLADCAQQLQEHGALTDAARIPAARPPKRRRFRRLVPWSGVLVLAVGMMAYGTGLMTLGMKGWRFLINRNDIYVDVSAGFESVTICTEDGQPFYRLETGIGASRHYFRLGPGRYRVQAKTGPGQRVVVDVQGEQFGSKKGDSHGPDEFHVERGSVLRIMVYPERIPVPTTRPPEPVEVPVAARDLPVGTAFDPDALKTDVTRAKVPKSKLSEHVVADPAALAGKLLTRLVRAGEPFDARDLTAARGPVIPPGHKLMSATLPPDGTAGGFAGPGARVDVWVALGDEKRPRTFRLLADVLVVSVDTSTAGKGAAGSAVVGFALRDADAELLTLAQARGGRLSLALRDPKAAADADKPHDPAEVRKRLQEP